MRVEPVPERQGDAEAALARIESELAGYYLLGLETNPIDRDGKRHSVKVSVSRSGASVRSRNQLVMPRASEPVGPRAAHRRPGLNAAQR